MSKIVLTFFVFCFVMAQSTWARPVLLELFTSQSCSACPPAEKAMEKLNEREDFFVLSFHVDYSSEQGRNDIFAKNEFTKRQTSYMRALGNGSLFTPQVIVDGSAETIGSWGWRVKMLGANARENQIKVPIHFMDKGERSYIKVPAFEMAKPADVWYVTYVAKAENAPESIENKGREVHSVNVVRTLKKLAIFKGQSMDIKLPKLVNAGENFAIFIQEQAYGKVVGLYRP